MEGWMDTLCDTDTAADRHRSFPIKVQNHSTAAVVLLGELLEPAPPVFKINKHSCVNILSSNMASETARFHLYHEVLWLLIHHLAIEYSANSQVQNQFHTFHSSTVSHVMLPLSSSNISHLIYRPTHYY